MNTGIIVEDAVLVWPSMGRFGADLKLVLNESLGRKFLKFVIHDQGLFAEMGGGSGEALLRRLREAGFVYCPNETAKNADAAYDVAMSRGLGVAWAELAVAQAKKTLYFYSSATRLSHARLSLMVPSLVSEGERSDYPLQPVSSFRESDLQFLPSAYLAEFIRSQQQLRDAKPGRWYVGPAERAAMAAVGEHRITVNEVLGYRDLPPSCRKTLPEPLAGFEAFSAVRTVEIAVHRQTLDVTGMPLRAPWLDAVLLGFPTREAAVAGNGGVDEGIEVCDTPYGIPVGFDAESGRLMVLKDARFLEYGADDVPALEDLFSVQRHLDFMQTVSAIRREYDALAAEGLLKADAWVDGDAALRARTRCDAIFELMKSALVPWGSTEGFLSEDAIKCYGSQRPDYFKRPENQGFIRFLSIFRTQLYNAVKQCSESKAARASFSAVLARLGMPSLDSPGAGDDMRRMLRGVPVMSRAASTPKRASAAHLATIVRRGETRRAGIDVDVDAFCELLGFRAVEAGIWLPDADRQRVLNEAFDALMDQAVVLGAAPEIIGLGGTLTLALGCRGEAERGASEAHFEPGRCVLHLPALQGAGTVSRAWALAFDAWLARTSLAGEYASIVDLSSSGVTGMGVFPAMVEDLVAVGRRMKSVPLSCEEAVRPWLQVEVGGEMVPMAQMLDSRLTDWLGTLDRQLPERMQQGDFYQYGLARLRAEWVDSPGLEQFGVRQVADMSAFVRDVCACMDAYFGGLAWRDGVSLELPGHLDRLSRDREAKARSVAEKWTPGMYRRDTAYFANASYHDIKERRVRWASDGALFARLFEAWTEASIGKVEGWSSPYLVAGTTLDADAERPVYPTGSDRDVLFGMLDEFFARHGHELRALACGRVIAPEAIRQLMPNSSASALMA